MAECQDLFEYDAALLTELDASLSTARLAPYLLEVGGADQVMAIKLYLWNARIAKAFLFPLHVAEVTVRNAVHSTLSTFFGGDQWIMPGGQIYPRLTVQSRDTVDKALTRLIEDGNAAPTPNDVIAKLTFDFWSNLFRKDYIWLWETLIPRTDRYILRHAFPNLPAEEGRGQIQSLVRSVNRFRNRVAHHEPVHKINHREVFDNILRLIGIRSLDTRSWVRRHSTVMAVIRSRPSPSEKLPGRSLRATNLVAPPAISYTTSMVDAMQVLAKARPSVAVISDNGLSPPYRVLTQNQVMNAVVDCSAAAGGVVDLTEHSVADIVGRCTALSVRVIDRDATTGDVAAAFFPQDAAREARPDVLLVLDGNSLVGVIARPDIRY